MTGNSVNLRAGPGTEYASEAIVHKGDLIQKIDTDGWIAVKQGGQVLWIRDRYIAQQDEV